ncbi:unnamed protein product [Arabidopsis arenosa]|uniref:Jacalin-type lectin domain-containing protein n=1 Tax=Arabidopsis arenosa TaxID=38785 RepID=A0A8S2ACX7_ARAAE|nr:unnamed protein product [Arabidopsis arenosa]
MNFMNVSVPIWSSLKVISYSPPSYFIDDKTFSLALCCFNKEGKACIYIAKGDKFHEIKINALVEDHTRHYRTYVPSLVPVPTFTMSTQQVESRFTPPRGIQASDGGNEWDDGIFHNVKKINVGLNDLDTVFVKFHYSKYNMTVAGAGHGNATTHIPEDEIMIAGGDYIEAVEGTYTESHITSITFRMYKGGMMPQYGRLNGMPFSLRGERGEKVIGFYGRSSDVHLTALGVHFSAPPLAFSFRQNDFGAVFVKFHYSRDNAIIAGAGHGDLIMIPDDDYIEAVEGTYNESHITSITFGMHKRITMVFGASKIKAKTCFEEYKPTGDETTDFLLCRVPVYPSLCYKKCLETREGAKGGKCIFEIDTDKSKCFCNYCSDDPNPLYLTKPTSA